MNLEKAWQRIPENCAIMAVVKANAYGLGAVPVAKRAVAEGAAMLGVATIGEGIELREAGIEAPILVLVQPRYDELSLAIQHTLQLTISDLDTAERLGDLARKAKAVASVHCEIDTGMGRQGFALADAVDELLNVTHISNVDIEGVFTHFASADQIDDPFTDQQIRSFRQVLKQLENEGIPYESAHASNSAGVLNHAHGAFDMIRVGLMTYGVWPGIRARDAETLEPVVRWTTKIVLLRDVAGGASVSYSRTYRAPGPTKLAALPVGYADGFRVGLSNVGEVLIRGKRCRVRGRVTMNEMLVDVTDVPEAQVGDDVVLVGSMGSESIAIEELAERAATISYEILTGIGASVAREYRQ